MLENVRNEKNFLKRWDFWDFCYRFADITPFFINIKNGTFAGLLNKNHEFRKISGLTLIVSLGFPPFERKNLSRLI